MILKRTLILCLLTVSICGYGQATLVDSLKNVLPSTNNDTVRLILLGRIMNGYRELNSDSTYLYALRTRDLARTLKLNLEESLALTEIGYALMNLGNYPRALESYLAAVAKCKEQTSEKFVLPARFPAFDEFSDRNLPARLQGLSNLSRTYQDMAILYLNANNFTRAKHYCEIAIPLAVQAKNLKSLSTIYSTLGRTYLFLNKADSALISHQKSYEYSKQIGYSRYTGSILLNLGRTYQVLGDVSNAEKFFNQALAESTRQEYFRGIVASNLELAKLYREANLNDSSFYFTTNGIKVAQSLGVPDLLVRCYRELASYYASINKSDSSSKYLSMIVEVNDQLFNMKLMQEFQNIDFEEQQRKQQLEAAEETYRNKLFKYTLTSGIGIVAVIAIILFRSNQQKQKDKSKIESAFTQLKATQSQLIQSEKMASLGELTAGIAHEIQNPLNFVNNFSEVSNELIDEMKSELQAGNLQGAAELAENVSQNLEKIAHHGKRADGIVKGMLQHSRISSGQKEATDINILCDEYLRLAYHGYRAKDKSFNATFETKFDLSLPTINVIPQEIGRVVLNLINNAFYAVNEKVKIETQDYAPTVKVSTKKLNDRIEIKVEDNGNGVPSGLKDKIFQPFFTTKPTGQGTGLGLSLSYDIIKAHGGTLEVNSVEGSGSEFIIQLSV